MRGLLVIGLVVWALCQSAGSALADPYRIRFTGLFGIRAFSSSSSLGSPTDTSLSNTVMVGARATRRWSDWLSFEAELPAMLTRTRDDVTRVFVTEPRFHGMFEIEPLWNVRPFALVGVGFPASVSGNRTHFESDVVPAGYVGLGGWFDRSKGLSLRLDLRTSVLPARGNSIVSADFEVFLTVYKLASQVEPPEIVEVIVRDSDGDGIVDRDDACPRRSEDRDEFDDTDGCPDIDDDRDEILDIADKCKFEPEIWNGFQDHDGCPDDVPEEVLALGGVIEKVLFARGAKTLRRADFRALDRMAAVLMKYPSVRGRIVGHTDNDGTPEADIDLAQARAETIKYYLVAKGVSEFRLGAVGVGAEQPMDDAGAEAAASLSRRAEFQLRRRE